MKEIWPKQHYIWSAQPVIWCIDKLWHEMSINIKLTTLSISGISNTKQWLYKHNTISKHIQSQCSPLNVLSSSILIHPCRLWNHVNTMISFITHHLNITDLDEQACINRDYKTIYKHMKKPNNFEKLGWQNCYIHVYLFKNVHK